jgi:choline dehydrogenase-like flavoprotein
MGENFKVMLLERGSRLKTVISQFVASDVFTHRYRDGGGSLTLDEAVIRDEALLNMCAVVGVCPKGSGSSAEQSLKVLYAMRREVLPRDVVKRLTRVVLDADQPAAAAVWTRKRKDAFAELHGGWSRARKNAQKLLQVLDVIDCCEQAPDPDNRVVLPHKRDRLGRRRLELHLRWSEEGKRTVRRGREILAEELTRARIGRFRPWTDLDSSARPLWPGVHHPMGTTRMHPKLTQGILNEYCRVHNVPNLFMAGSSVLPTGLGYANPTFTPRPDAAARWPLKTIMTAAPEIAALRP